MSLMQAARRVSAAMLVVGPMIGTIAAHATTVNFNYTGMNGYTAVGSFSYNGATAPTIITESGSGPTVALQSFGISFYNPAHTLLETGSSVVNSVSSDNFFRLTYNTLTNSLTTLDADIGGTAYQYFLTNLRTPTGSVVPTGQTTFNFFNRSSANAALDTAASIPTTVAATTATPEPSTWALLLSGGLALLAARFARRRGGAADAA